MTPTARPERFWSKVDKTQGCWLWTAATNKRGYGVYQLGRGKGTVLAHRYAYELKHGTIPNSQPLDHLCRVSKCVNPLHLDVTTAAENTRRNLQLYILANRRRAGLVTHCPQRHEYTAENTYRDKRNTRHCKECVRVRNRADYYKRKESIS